MGCLQTDLPFRGAAVEYDARTGQLLRKSDGGIVLMDFARTFPTAWSIGIVVAGDLYLFGKQYPPPES
ncbi:MAG: hypothetical protein ABIN18_30560 [Pseudomonadota bacterium]